MPFNKIEFLYRNLAYFVSSSFDIFNDDIFNFISKYLYVVHTFHT